MTKAKKKAVIVTTEFRGVFFGYLEEYNKKERRAILSKIRNVLFWHSDTNGFLGLAKTGPKGASRIGAEAPMAELHKITCVADCTKEAVKAFGEY